MVTKAEKARPALQQYVFEAWVRWLKHLYDRSVLHNDGTITISRAVVDRWFKSMRKPLYEDLNDRMKDWVDGEADRIIEVIDEAEEL